MIMQEMVERFEKQAPMCVMLRAMLENVFAEQRLNVLFESAAQLQQNKTLLFSTVADMMGLVALKIHPTVHAAYQAKKKELAVTAKAVYDKLQRMEPGVSRSVVRETGAHIRQIIDKTQGAWSPLLPGYHVKILDGNHLRRTQRRLQELSALNAAPLPGHCLVVLDPQRKLVIDVFPCEDGHAQERSLLPAVLETVRPRDLWIADRNFCTGGFLAGIAARGGYIVIREHGSSLRYELLGRRKKVGVTDTGVVYEQSMQCFVDGGPGPVLRRITVGLFEPTRDGDQEIHLLTNLPKRVSALTVADLYRDRWTIETAFQEVAANLEGEIETLGYPRAALFAFCMALVAFNLVSVIRAAMRAAHPPEETKKEVSIYYLCDEIAHTHRGLGIAIDDRYWTKTYASLTPGRLARQLVRLAHGTDVSRYQKHPRGPKKPKKQFAKKGRNHVSTARVLMESRGYKVQPVS
jgi:IS4 transposase